MVTTKKQKKKSSQSSTRKEQKKQTPFKEFALTHAALLRDVGNSLVQMCAMTIDGVVRIKYDGGREYEFREVSYPRITMHIISKDCPCAICKTSGGQAKKSGARPWKGC